MTDGTIFGTRLRTLRRNQKETQQVLADLLDVSTTQISDMEKGRRTTGINNVIKLCRHYNVSADYLLGLIDEPRPLEPEDTGGGPS